jgi:hypothetical protein
MCMGASCRKLSRSPGIVLLPVRQPFGVRRLDGALVFAFAVTDPKSAVEPVHPPQSPFRFFACIETMNQFEVGPTGPVVPDLGRAGRASLPLDRP